MAERFYIVYGFISCFVRFYIVFCMVLYRVFISQRARGSPAGLPDARVWLRSGVFSRPYQTAVLVISRLYRIAAVVFSRLHWI